jgi:Cu2+-containing amine oxidase
MIDGINNQVTQVDVVPDDADVGSDENFYGNGFKTVKQTFKTSKEAQSNYDAAKTRCWAIENPNKQHYSTGSNIAYKIVSKDMPPMLAKPGSHVWNRAPFARHNVSRSLSERRHTILTVEDVCHTISRGRGLPLRAPYQPEPWWRGVWTAKVGEPG